VESIVIEPTATGKGSFARRTVRVAALPLLFGLLAPPGVLPGPAAASGNPSSRGVMVGDNSAVLPGKVRVSGRLFGLPGLTNEVREKAQAVDGP
jgi:hypothetical protein